MNNRNQTDKQEYVANEGRTDYVVHQSRRANIIAYILSLAAALVLWGYVSMTEQADTTQIVFNAMNLEFDGESELKDQYGLIVQSVSEENLSVTLSGKAQDISDLSSSDIRLYVNLSEQTIDSAGTFELPVHVEVPDGFETTLSTQTVHITIDKPDTKVFEVGSENVRLVGWILESGCSVSRQSINISKVTLEGNSANLSRVVGVEIRTDAIGMITSSDVIVSAGVYLLDEAGQVLDLPVSIRTDAPQGGVEVTLSVQKQATVDLTVGQLNGYLKGEGVLTVSPAKVLVTGALEQINELLHIGGLSLNLPNVDFVTEGKIDERKILEDQILSDLEYILPEGMEDLTVTLEDGSPFVGATLNVQVSKIRSETVELTEFTLSDPEHFATAPASALQVTFRSAGNDGMFEQFLNDLAHSTLYVDTDSYNPDTHMARVEVRLSNTYNSDVYAVGEYSVELILIESPPTG